MWKKIIITIVLIIAGIIALVFYATAGMTDVATEFFIHVKTKHYDDAYNMLSKEFKKSTTQDRFKDFIIASGLTNFKSVSWDERSFENNMGKLDGVVTTKDGGSIPITLNFIKVGEDEWQIYSIYKKSAGLKSSKPSGILSNSDSQAEKDSIKMPSKDEILSLVNDNMLRFAKGLNAKDMTIFYNGISKLWQQNISVERLNSVFKPFMDQNADFTILQNYTPILDKEPILTDQNMLMVEGHYPTSPSVVKFKNNFMIDDGEWKLVGYNIAAE
ncbi:hypothetical protein MNB_SV-6-1124 [hydrothermal vent metagenome]|uniref:DUF4878 domain-containing protein n=1 Tax=hydrothermal vent metagenome TaxID=652676 RepID=A0A1W1BCJ3_9ZZZZ